MKIIIRLILTLFMVCSIAQLYATFDPRDTRQIVIDIDTTLITCCTTLQNDFTGTFTSLAALESLIGTGCSPVLITQAMVGTTGFVITQSGVYQLASNIVFNPIAPASAITINASNVLFDLTCFSITQGNVTAGVNAISIGNKTNVTVHNGAIMAMTGDGITVAAGASNISLADIEIILSGAHGIFFNGTSGNPIITIMLVGLELLSNGTGITLSSGQQGTITECSILNSAHAGIEFINSFSNKVNECTVADTQAVNDSAVGISAVMGGNNSFINCLIDNTSTTVTASTSNAVGVLLGATENNDVIMNNQISNTITASNARPFGIQMSYTFTALSNSGLPGVTDGSGVTAVVNAVDWTTNGRFLATGSGTAASGLASVYEFTGNALTFVSSIAQSGVTSVSWSPDGSFLAAGDKSAAPSLCTYSFNGTSLAVAAPAVTFAAGNFVNAVNWSLDGRFIALGLTTATQVSVYEFSNTPAPGTLTAVTTAATTAVTALDWSPDGNFLAIGNTTQVIVYRFDGQTLTQVAAFTHGAAVNSVNWSLDGRFIAMGGAESGGIDVRVLNFTGAALTQVASFDHGAAVQSVNWSPDAQYVALGGTTSGGFDTQVLLFTGNSLLLVSSFSNGATVNTIEWSPLGNVLAIGSSPVGVTNSVIRILSGLQFPSGTIIRNNIITLTNGPALAVGLTGVSIGRGLSASSSSNLIIQNTAFANDVNYVFVDNVFRQYVANTSSPVPTLIANLSFPPL